MVVSTGDCDDMGAVPMILIGGAVGAGLGTAVGGLVGSTVGVLVAVTPTGDCDDMGDDTAALLGNSIGGALGATVGGLAGSSVYIIVETLGGSGATGWGVTSGSGVGSVNVTDPNLLTGSDGYIFLLVAISSRAICLASRVLPFLSWWGLAAPTAAEICSSLKAAKTTRTNKAKKPPLGLLLFNTMAFSFSFFPSFLFPGGLIAW